MTDDIVLNDKGLPFGEICFRQAAMRSLAGTVRLSPSVPHNHRADAEEGGCVKIDMPPWEPGKENVPWKEASRTYAKLNSKGGAAPELLFDKNIEALSKSQGISFEYALLILRENNYMALKAPEPVIQVPASLGPC